MKKNILFLDIVDIIYDYGESKYQKKYNTKIDLKKIVSYRQLPYKKLFPHERKVSCTEITLSSGETLIALIKWNELEKKWNAVIE